MVNVGAIQRVPVVVCTRSGANAETSYLGDKQTPHFAQRFSAAYLAEKIHFTRTIQKDLKSTPNLKDGRAALDIGLAAFESTYAKKLVKLAE